MALKKSQIMSQASWKERIYLRIGSTDDISSYLARLYQQTQGTAASSAAYTYSSLSGIPAFPDTVEISEDAYNSLSSENASAMKPPPPPKDGPDEALRSLVEEGTITSDQASAIKDAIINAVDEEGASVASDLSGQSEEAGSNPLETLLLNLVSDGTLSEDQAASVAEALKPPPPPPPALTDSSGEESV
jgi:polyhydroxyalkanoate synthesis regulator phasin